MGSSVSIGQADDTLLTREEVSAILKDDYNDEEFIKLTGGSHSLTVAALKSAIAAREDSIAARKWEVDTVSKTIRQSMRNLKLLKKNNRPAEDIAAEESILINLFQKYEEFSGEQFSVSAEDLLEEFLEDYFDVLDSTDKRKVSNIGAFYHPEGARCSTNISGAVILEGSLPIAAGFVEMFRGSTVKHLIDKVEVDASPPKRCDVYVSCSVRLQIDNDMPRKLLEVFEFKKESGTQMLISNHLIVLLDRRPLYCWPEGPIPMTKNDNWEPQFKPKGPSPEELAAIAAAEEAEAMAAAAALIATATVSTDERTMTEEGSYEEGDGEDEEGDGDATEADGAGVEREATTANALGSSSGPLSTPGDGGQRSEEIPAAVTAAVVDTSDAAPASPTNSKAGSIAKGEEG